MQEPLVIEREFSAKPERLWQAWTTEEMSSWSYPHGMSCEDGFTNLELDGQWGVTMVGSSKDKWVLRGHYRKIEKPSKLVFTHQWVDTPNGDQGPETLISVDFEPSESGGTKMVFRQEGFASEESRSEHESGWSECFERLGKFLQ